MKLAVYASLRQFITLYDTSCHKQVSDRLKPIPAIGNSFMKMHLNKSSAKKGPFNLPRRSWVLFHGPHPPVRDWLAQDSAVSRAWTSVERSRHFGTDSNFGISLRWALLIHIDRDTHTIAMIADALASNRRQTISITVLISLWLHVYCVSRVSYYIH